VFVNMTAILALEMAADFHVAVFDAHTGRRLNQSQFGGSFLDIVLRLHRELFMELSGELIMERWTCASLHPSCPDGPFMRRLDFGTYRSQSAPRAR
jgi:hypothetical protein